MARMTILVDTGGIKERNWQTWRLLMKTGKRVATDWDVRWQRK